MAAANALAHFLVDAVCAAALLQAQDAILLAPLLFLYNTLAFSSQCLAGLITDRIGHCALLSPLACLIVAFSFFFPLPGLWRAVGLGLGNSLFHVAGGSLTLEGSGGRPGPLGFFVAPGAVGLSLGGFMPRLGPVLAGLLVLCAILLLFLGRGWKASSRKAVASSGQSGVAVALLLLAVSARALGGAAAAPSWQHTGVLALLPVLFVFLGKAGGGLVCDWAGVTGTALLSLPASALLIAFGSGNEPLFLVGQLLLNLSMPVTLWLLYREMPDSPGFSFGLAASALWPGQIAGRLLAKSVGGRWPWILLSFALGLFAILYTEKRRTTP